MLIGMWDRIALTRHQEFVVSALRILDPSVEDVAPQLARGGFIVRRSGQAHFPIGSLGEGTIRMLALAIAMTQCRGGLLLVDEIDTGLHYSVLSRMWELVYRAAVEMDVQVFATTHSHDCIQSLSLISSELADRDGITIQRVEQGKPRAGAYSHEEVAILAAHDIEVR
jgi:predicted ATPase